MKSKIYQKCYQCGGLKEVISSDTQAMIECPICNGKGYIEWGYVKEE